MAGKSKANKSGTVRIGIGGWTYEPWRGVFYPKGLTQKKELEYASGQLGTIEINGTYYSTFKPESWRQWRDTVPEGFVFAVKASRYCTNRRELAGMGESMARFLDQGLTELGAKLGPINWQFMETKKFDPADFEAFLKLLPKEKNGVALRHAVEVRHESFKTQAFYDLCTKYGVAIVCAEDEDFPHIDEATAPFIYARFMATHEDAAEGIDAKTKTRIAKVLTDWSARGDVFAYFISGAKVRNPAAAMAVAAALKKAK